MPYSEARPIYLFYLRHLELWGFQSWVLGTITIPMSMQALGNDISNTFGCLVFFFKTNLCWHLHAMIKINDHYSTEYSIIFSSSCLINLRAPKTKKSLKLHPTFSFIQDWSLFQIEVSYFPLDSTWINHQHFKYNISKAKVYYLPPLALLFLTFITQWLPKFI